ncbi:MAG: TetR family transcriptional regulator [Candidatus Acidiferrales bacterium]
MIRAITPMPRPSAIPGHPNATRSSGRRERHRAQTRDRLYRAALDLFAQRGFLETTVEDITEAADVGKGTFFNYFRTKEHILAEFGGERVAAVERALEKARTTDGPVMDVIRELAGDAAGQSDKSAALLRAIFAAHASCKPVRDELVKRSQIAKRILTDIFLLGQERGEIRRNIPAADLAHLTQIVFMGVTISWSLKEPHSSLRKTCEEIWDLICPNLEINGGRLDQAGSANRKLRKKS